MTKPKNIANSVFIIVIFSIVSKILGFLRELLIAQKFGADGETDVFFVSLAAVSIFISMTTISINRTLIPVLSEIEAKNGKGDKKKHLNNFLNITIVISILLVLITLLASPFIIKVMAFGFDEEQFRLAVSLLRIGIPAIIFSCIIGIFRGYLQSEFRFIESALSQLPFNGIYILFLLFLSNKLGIKGLAVTAIIATASQIPAQIYGLKELGYKYKFYFDLKDRYIKKVSYLIPPVLISGATYDLNIIIDKSLASTLAEGSISALNYANKIYDLTVNIFIASIITVLYPILSKKSNEENYESLKNNIINGMNTVILLTVPSLTGMVILAKPIVKVIFERGAFDPNSTSMTAGALIFYSVGLAGASLKSLINNVFYSLQDTKIPMISGFIAIFSNIILNFALIKPMGHRGLALATSISLIITFIFLLVMLRRKIGSFGITKSIKCGAKSLIASIVMGVIVYYLNMRLGIKMGSDTLSELISLLASVGVGVLVYSAIIYFSGIEEVDWMIRIVKERLRK
jgi:putative peptidoglycan lipid II flippase